MQLPLKIIKYMNVYMPQSKKAQDKFDVLEQIDVQCKDIIYELPLSEKIRTFIRLESLFDEIAFHLQGNTVWHSRSAVNSFIDILNVFARPEIKTDLMKEMDRINANLSKYTAMSGVNTDRLVAVQEKLLHLAKNLRAMEGQIGQGLKQNELIMSIRQRNSVPGGALVMDLPVYGHWLASNIDTRKNDIQTWLEEFSLVKEAVCLILELLRDSTVATDVVAKAGFYQHVLDAGTSNQILRVILPKSAPYFPEISGGRHRFTVRFLKPMGFDRPVQIEQDVSFRLICCAL
ncbi:MAG TPA: cell division protein ZapD [Gammaproteobacteria bacterium]|nr:cell division protein ZapD [Gammaproteobacteria bacterium]